MAVSKLIPFSSSSVDPESTLPNEPAVNPAVSDPPDDAALLPCNALRRRRRRVRRKYTSRTTWTAVLSTYTPSATAMMPPDALVKSEYVRLSPGHNAVNPCKTADTTMHKMTKKARKFVHTFLLTRQRNITMGVMHKRALAAENPA